MLKTKWTVADVLAESPCLSPDEIRCYFGDNETLTIQQILALPALRNGYKVWMACRVNAVPSDVYARWQAVILTRAITAFALPEPSTHDWAICWLDGTDRTCKTAARAARVAGATWAAGAAWWAAEAAGAAGAAGAAWWAVQAAGAAGAAEATEAARAAEQHQQVRDLRQLLDSV